MNIMDGNDLSATYAAERTQFVRVQKLHFIIGDKQTDNERSLFFL